MCLQSLLFLRLSLEEVTGMSEVSFGDVWKIFVQVSIKARLTKALIEAFIAAGGERALAVLASLA